MAGVLAYAPAVDEEPKATIVSGPPRAIIRAQFGSGYCRAVKVSGTAQSECGTVTWHLVIPGISNHECDCLIEQAEARSRFADSGPHRRVDVG